MAWSVRSERRPSGDSYLYAFTAEPKHKTAAHRAGRHADDVSPTAPWEVTLLVCQRAPAAGDVQLDVHFIDAVRIGEFVEASAGSSADRARSSS